MLAEALQYSLHRLRYGCPPAFREMGYLAESIAIEARNNRQRKHWLSHQKHCKQLIQQACQRVKGRDIAMVLGAGLLLDIPLKTLSETFKKVYLVDVIHLSEARIASKTLRNVHLLEHDVTGCIVPWFEDCKKGNKSFVIQRATLGLPDTQVDLIISANLMSQLPIFPLKYLEKQGYRNEEHLDQMHYEIMDAHLKLLQSSSGLRCLLTDTHHIYHDSRGELLEEVELFDLKTLAQGDNWIWNLAPLGEMYPDKALSHRVRGCIF